MNLKIDKLVNSEPILLENLVAKKNDHYKLKKDTLLNQIGNNQELLYCFWWIGGKKKFEDYAKNFNVTLKGKLMSNGGELDINKENQHVWHEVFWSLNWFPENLKHYPLYVGKSTVFGSRLSQHLMLQTLNFKSRDRFTLDKKTTSCQFRSGFEHLFGYKNDISFLIQNIGITIQHEPDFVERFYLEDLAVGYLRPWFNIDSER